MTELATKRPKRLFAFGCSFTRYHWTTWPEFVAYDLNIPYYNYGRSGAGNQYISNMVAQADATYSFDEDDLVMITWTNVAREDRWVKGDWVTPGNIFTQGDYDETFVRKWADPVGYMIRDFASIHLTKNLLDNKKCKYHMLSMCNIQTTIDQSQTSKGIEPKYKLIHEELCKKYSETLDTIQPSFFDVLWENNVYGNKLLKEKNIWGGQYSDGHPSPMEHYKYLERIFTSHNFRPETYNEASRVQKNYINFILEENKKHSTSYAIYQVDKKDQLELKRLTEVKTELQKHAL